MLINYNLIGVQVSEGIPIPLLLEIENLRGRLIGRIENWFKFSKRWAKLR